MRVQPRKKQQNMSWLLPYPFGNSIAGITVIALAETSQELIKSKLILNALPEEAGSLIKGSGYLDYFNRMEPGLEIRQGNLASRSVSQL